MNSEALFPSNSNVTRSLTAILFTRATNFGSVSSSEQANILSVLQRDFRVMRQLCRVYRGQVIKSIGESLLMTFSSGSNAVTCALKIQEQLTQLAAENKAGQMALHHSIGIHLGEVFLSETDVMGSEVNIAMQLQAEVPANGICISHPLYEVVKLSTQLQVKPLGEHLLKGATSSLVLYQVVSERASPSLEVQKPTPPDISELEQLLAPLNLAAPSEPLQPLEVAKALEQHAEVNRIKRLLLWVCRNTWETNLAVLETVAIADLLSDLKIKFPQYVSLRDAFQLAVSRLNKQVDYQDSLAIILRQAKLLYEFHPSDLAALYRRIAQQLEKYPNKDRVKKLLFWALREQWEQNPTVLRQIPMTTILTELSLRAANISQLQGLLHRATQSLNKASEYQTIAEFICTALDPLYDELQGLDTAGSVSQRILKAPEKERSDSPDAHASGGHLLASEVGLRDESANSPAIMPVANTTLPKQLSAEQVFQLRFSLMQRTNPLRLKALLYSTLYEPISLSDRSGSILQQHSLDSLLINLVTQETSFEALRQKLNQVVFSQSPSEEHLQVLEVLLRVIESELLGQPSNLQEENL